MIAQYIAFEGIDGSGKTKQVELLTDYLRGLGKKVLVTKEFGSEHNSACTSLRSFALNSVHGFDELAGQFMFAACSTQHSAKVIGPAIRNYDYIISDRSVESNLAYCAALGYREFAHALFFLDKRRIYPNTILFLDVTPDITWHRAMARNPEKFEGGVDRIEAKGQDFQELVYAEYKKRENEANYININSDQSIEKIHAAVKLSLEV